MRTSRPSTSRSVARAAASRRRTASAVARWGAETATDEATREVYDGIADGHYDRRRNLLFWTLLTVVYGVIDAYVDGYLGRFDEEIEDRRELFGSIDPAAQAVEVGVRF